jgi:hypothetical protein
MSDGLDICFFTSATYLDDKHSARYLAECERLRIPFVIHFDRCPQWFKQKFRESVWYRGETSQDDPSVEFNEMHKQGSLDLICRRFDWACAMDLDETWEPDFPGKVTKVLNPKYDLVDVRWVNLWGDTQHVRVDSPFDCCHRVKFMNLKSGHVWYYRSKVTNGCYSNRRDAVTSGLQNLLCLHWGFVTRQDRIEHKERWDRIYTKAVGKNPYGFWNLTCDESITPQVITLNEYLEILNGEDPLHS